MGRGHLFIIDGDLTKIAVDAWYLPVDQSFNVTSHWVAVADRLDPHRTSRHPWKEGELARYLGSEDGADVWWGNVGRNDSTVSHYQQCALQFIELAAARIGSERSLSLRRPLVALPHLGTGKGGAKSWHGTLVSGLIEAITGALNDGRIDVDVVLVSYGPTPEAAAQRARFGTSDNWREDPQWQFEIDQERLHSKAIELANLIQRDQAAIFMGAGVSIGAGLPGWVSLLEKIGQQTNPVTTSSDLNSMNDPRDMANLLQRRLEREGKSLANLLSLALGSTKYSLQHGLIASLPCNEFITTNVDDLFERAATATQGDLKVVPNQAESDRWLLKLHGTITDETSLVFTRDNFLDLGRGSRALFGLVQAMLFTKHMLFVGYGLGDEDFHEVVYDVRSAFPNKMVKRRIGTALIPKDDPIKRELWDDTLDIVSMRPANHDIDEAVRDLERFIDLIGMLASDRSAFLLESRYYGMLTDGEKLLAEKLGDLVESASGYSDDDSAWREVRQLLRRLGARLR